MAGINRREFAGILSAAGLAPALSAAIPSRETRAVEAPANVTRTLASYVVHAKPDDIPAPIVAEARRTLVNWVGCALGGARHETLDNAVAALQPFSGPPQATLLGRRSGWTRSPRR